MALKLFSEWRCRDVVLKNRIVASPMCQYDSPEGRMTDWHIAHLGRMAIGGCGLVFVEESAVEREGRKTHRCAGIYEDAQLDGLTRVADVIRSIGSVPAMQLGHAGRKAAVHGAMKDWAPLTEADTADGFAPWRPVSASPLPVGPTSQIPEEASPERIASIVTAFADAARRADRAGFDVLEIHGAHGYLIHQFLSPATNIRIDRYGGDAAGRRRFPLEVAEAVRAAWPQGKPLFYRISCVDGAGGAFGLSDAIAFARELKGLGIDAVDCSSGGIGGESDMPAVPRIPGFHLDFADRVRREADIQTVAVGAMHHPALAEEALQTGKADLIALARGLMEDADWPLRAARELSQTDPYTVFPDPYSHRLSQRDEQLKMEINQSDQAKIAMSALLDS